MPRVREANRHQASRAGRAGSAPIARPRTRPEPTSSRIDHLESDVLTLVRRRHEDTYALLVLVGEFDRHGYWAVRGALSCAAWLADLCDIEIGTARTQVRVARALVEFPTLNAAMASGSISYAKARTLAAHLTADNAEALLAIAATTPAGDLGTAIAAWSLRNEDQDVIDERQHQQRSMSWRVEPDGMVTFTIKLPPEQAAPLQAMIDAETMRHVPEPVDHGGLEDGSDASADACRRTAGHDLDSGIPVAPSLAQQRADALCRIIEHGGNPTHASQTSRGTPATEIVVHVDAEGNTLADGTPLSDNAVTRMLPEAFISLLLHDNARRPIDASPRRRAPTRRQRRVIDARQDECAQPGCHARTFLQYDHVVPFPQGGPTILDNLQRLCGPHNRAKDPRPGPACR